PVGLLEEHLAAGWEYDVEVVIDAPVDRVARCLPRALGKLTPVGAGTARLTGTTSNPIWYAEQLAVIPAPYRIVRCPELRRSARVLGQRLLAAASDRDGDLAADVAGFEVAQGFRYVGEGVGGADGRDQPSGVDEFGEGFEVAVPGIADEHGEPL